MANSGFSNRSRRRFAGSGASRYDDRYDDYRGGRSYEPDYRSPTYNPYDYLDDVSGVGEVRTRAASSGRYHPPLLSFNEARRNSYVGDRLRYDSRDRSRTTARRFEVPGASYKPRVRDAVNVGHSSEYNDAQPAVQPASAQATRAAATPDGTPASSAPTGGQRVSAAGTPISASGFDPFASFQGAGAPSHSPKRRVKVLAPTDYSQAADVARALRAGDVVVLALAQVPGDLAKRILDFSFGAASALDAGVECVAEKVFVIARGQALLESERAQLRSQGIIK